MAQCAALIAPYALPPSPLHPDIAPLIQATCYYGACFDKELSGDFIKTSPLGDDWALSWEPRKRCMKQT